MLYRPSRVLQPATTYLRYARTLRGDSHRRPLSCSARQPEQRPKRYGTANEPAPHLNTSSTSESDRAPVPSKEVPAEQQTAPRSAAESAPAEATTPADEAAAAAVVGASEVAAEHQQQTTKQNGAEQRPKAGPKPHISSPELETVLHMPSPSQAAKDAPYLKTPPYVHHFDTFGLVRRLEEGGFKEDQSVTIMKAVRGLLTQNMDLAKDGLVSKSDVENETYLFRAACSELKTEVENNRKAELEKMRIERAQLQHEVDILSQRLTQESQSLKDALKGMFDDRTMAVRMEHKNMEGKTQELNYKITVELNSDARGDIESLRWIVARRAAIAVAVSALMILSTLRYASYMSHSQAEERKKLAAEKKNREKNEESSGRNGNGGGNGNGITNGGNFTAARSVDGGTEGLIVGGGGEKGFVSLG